MIRATRTYRYCASSPARPTPRPAISPKPSRHLVIALRFSTITMAARRERLQARLKGFLVRPRNHCTAHAPVNNVNCGDGRFDLLVTHAAVRLHSIIVPEMKTALISLEETEMTTLEMIAEEGRNAGASKNDIQSPKMFIPARPRPLLAARYAGPP